jgi:hypothetical protein
MMSNEEEIPTFAEITDGGKPLDADATTQPAEPEPSSAEAVTAPERRIAPESSVQLTVTGPQSYTVSGTITLQSTGAVAPGTFPSGALERPPAIGAESINIFGRGEEAAQARDKLVGAVQDFLKKIGEAIEKTVADVTTLEVLTYTSEDISKVDNANIKGTASLRAITHIMPDGDIEVCVPAREGRVDEALWAIHSDMVERAQTNRAEMIRTAVEAITGLVKVA